MWFWRLGPARVSLQLFVEVSRFRGEVLALFGDTS
jgi:hypothetical protein